VVAAAPYGFAHGHKRLMDKCHPSTGLSPPPQTG
jgi:hypothetical protein